MTSLRHLRLAIQEAAQLFDKNIDEAGSAMDAAYGDEFRVTSNLALPKTPPPKIG